MKRWEKRLAQIEQEAARQKAHLANCAAKSLQMLADEKIARIAKEKAEEERRSRTDPVKAIVEKVFPYCGHCSVNGTMDFLCISFSACDSAPEVTFDQLAKLSELLHTRKINFGEISLESDGCESCHHGRYWSFEIRVENASLTKLWPPSAGFPIRVVDSPEEELEFKRLI